MKTPSNFISRTITGSIFVVAILASMLHFVSFFIALYILLVLSINEFAKLFKEKESIVISERKIGLATLPVIATFTVFYFELGIDYLWLFAAIFLIGILGMFSLELFHKKTNQMKNVAYSFFAYFYIVLPFACLIYVYAKNPLYALALFAFIWVHDTFSYLVGMKFGKNKLFERISPSKTWEGFIGGLCFVIISTLAFYFFTPFREIKEISDPYLLFKWIGMGIVVVISGTFGDLFESLLKRSLDVKDSGTLLPGHGGLLDRLDSILFAAPAVAVYLMMVNW